MVDVAGNLRKLKAETGDNVCLVAVSKVHPATLIMDAYNAGQRVFGENRVQELLEKQNQLPQDIQWHFIGHLQSKKVKYIAPFIDLIHSIDSVKLLEEVNTHAQVNDRIIRVLLQIHIAQEETKYGFSYEECRQLLVRQNRNFLPNVRICGLMGMATFTNDTGQIKKEFAGLRLFFRELKEMFFAPEKDFNILSMGMSDDYPVAIQEGSNMIRVGSKIFGTRE